MYKVGLIINSRSDLDIAGETIKTLRDFGVEYDVVISSAHKTPSKSYEWCKNARENGYICIIAFAGASAHLAGLAAGATNVPVLAVPISATCFSGVDALYSTIQMPAGIPVAVMSAGKAGAKNAAIFACQMIAHHDGEMYEALVEMRESFVDKIEQDNKDLPDIIAEL